MAFTLEQKLAHYRAHPEKRRALQARWRAHHRRRAEIAGALASLLSAHRLRVIGVRIDSRINWRETFDSWATK